jgi:hypothetical protein
MRHIFSLAETQAGGRLSGAKSKKLRLGLFSLTLEQRRDNSSRGGRTQGPIQGRQNVETGQLDRIRELPQTKLAQSVAGKINGKATGLKYGPLVDMDKVRTLEGCQKGQLIGGPKSRHVRWHVKRKLFNLACEYCLAAIERKESWGVIVQEPGF